MERERATGFIHELLELLVKQKGSDLFITAGFPPALKVDGRISPVSKTALTPQHTMELVRSVMNDKQASEFESTKECNFAIAPPGVGPLPRQCVRPAGPDRMVLRTITTEIPKFEELGLPPVLKDVIMSKRGIMLFVGATGSGKSTSMASLLGFRNENSYGHIITIEDPIEFVHDHRNCIVTQREVGVDTDDWDIALRNSLRQAPDVILIGEVRARETMDYAISFAETGHLCLATLHANSTNQALDRIINFFPEDRRAQLLMDLSLNIRAFVGQRLLPRRDGKGRVPAVEVMLNSPLISDLIFKGDVSGIKELMKKSRELGMQTFDQSLFGPLRGRPHQLRGRAAQRRLAERPAPRHQAPRQGSQGAQRLLRDRQPRHRSDDADRTQHVASGLARRPASLHGSKSNPLKGRSGKPAAGL
jgi:twitching motility protein PilU